MPEEIVGELGTLLSLQRGWLDNHFPTGPCCPECTLSTKSLPWRAVFHTPPCGWTLAGRQISAGDNEPDYAIHPCGWSPACGGTEGGSETTTQVEPRQEVNVCLCPQAGQSWNTLSLSHGTIVLCHQEAPSLCHGGVVKCQNAQCLCCGLPHQTGSLLGCFDV